MQTASQHGGRALKRFSITHRFRASVCDGFGILALAIGDEVGRMFMPTNVMKTRDTKPTKT